MTCKVLGFSLTVYISKVWWGWWNASHVHGLRWGMLYIGRVGIGWDR